MRSVGRIQSCLRDILTEKMAITLLVDDLNIEELNELSGIDVDIEVKKHKKERKRSLDSNAYFHLLLGKMAEHLCISKPQMKNIILARYGQREMLNGECMSVMIRWDISMEDREDIHTALYGYEVIDGVTYYKYYVIRGSHTYNSEEMSKLIEGTVSDAKELGIETMTPDEIMRMNVAWQSR